MCVDEKKDSKNDKFFLFSFFFSPSLVCPMIWQEFYKSVVWISKNLESSS